MTTEQKAWGTDMAVRYGWDLVTGMDWGHGHDEQSDYEYDTPTDALRAARDRMAVRQFDPQFTGIYVYEEGSDGDVGWFWIAQIPTTLFGMSSDVADITLEVAPA